MYGIVFPAGSTMITICFVDVNECLVKNGGCEHNCTNLIGSYNCICNEGFELNQDGHTCNGKP